MASRTLTVQIIGDPASASRAFRRTTDDAKKMGDRMDREGKRIHGFASLTSKGFGRVGVAATGMAGVGAGAAALLTKSFVSGASDIQESLSKNQVLFGRYAADIDKFSKTSASAFGISRQAALEYTGTFGNLFRATGVARQESAKFSVGLTKLASDMASFNNTSIEDALEAIRSGIVGESEPLRRFGVNLNDAQMRTEALRQGLVKTTKEALNPQQKALAAQALIIRQTSAAHGDFARTSGGLANQQRILRARLADAGAELGNKLVPFALKAVRALNSLFDSSSKGGRVLRQIGRWIDGAAGDFNKFARATQRSARDSDSSLATIRRSSLQMGRGIKSVTDSTVLPAFALIGRKVREAAKSVQLAWRGVIALVNGDWRQAWRNFRAAAENNFGGLLRSLQKADTAILNTVRRLGRGIVRGIVNGLEGLGDAVFRGIKKGITTAADKAADWIDKANPLSRITGNIGDGIGRKIGDGVGKSGIGLSVPGGKWGGGLDGADSDLGPFARIGAGMGLHVSSGIRPGAVTSSGNPSFHASGDAIDMVGPMAAMRRFAVAMRQRFGGRLRELISPWAGLGIKDGKPYQYSSGIIAQHSGSNAHVHLAYTGPSGDGIGQIRNLWTRAGGSASKANLAAAIAMAESRGNPGAVNRNTDGSTDRGLWQINSIHGSLSTFDRLANARAAVKISSNGMDWTPWTVYKTGAYRQFLTSGGTGAGGGGGGGGARGAFGRSQSAAARGAGRAVSAARSLTSPGGGGYESNLAEIDVKKAGAEGSGNVKAMIAALYEEAFQKRTRLRKVNRALKRRLKKETRQRLTEERAQLIRDLQAIGELAQEYAAHGMAEDGSPGSPAEAAEVEAGPTPLDFLDAAVAEAALTEGTADDLAAGVRKRDFLFGELLAARQSGDPRRVAEAAAAFQAAADAVKQLQTAIEDETETRRRLVEEMAGLRAEMKQQNEFSRSVAGIATREAIRALADVISGQIVGTGLQGRRQTAGNGTVVLIP